jgi:hypothetical protein
VVFILLGIYIPLLMSLFASEQQIQSGSSLATYTYHYTFSSASDPYMVKEAEESQLSLLMSANIISNKYE